MTIARLVVPKNDVADTAVVEEERVPLGDGEVRLSIDLFGLSSNNITYALFGDMLGYWAHFPVDDGRGCVPVWGFADVVESSSTELAAGERVFGYLPLASELVVSPHAVTDLAFSDRSSHRSALHPWYGRYYRCAGDPLWRRDEEAMQATMWALFMTGWALGAELAASADAVVVSSASSKTALSTAWSLHQIGGVRVVGVTSEANRAFVDATGVYDAVTTYDDLDFSSVGESTALVDTAGSPGIKERIHAELGDRLVDSVMLGATHQGKGEGSGDLTGPAPRLFFIPDVAEQRAAETSLAAYHSEFSEAWRQFTPWFANVLSFEASEGVDAVREAYHRVLGGEVGPDTAVVLRW